MQGVKNYLYIQCGSKQITINHSKRFMRWNECQSIIRGESAYRRIAEQFRCSKDARNHLKSIFIPTVNGNLVYPPDFEQLMTCYCPGWCFEDCGHLEESYENYAKMDKKRFFRPLNTLDSQDSINDAEDSINADSINAEEDSLNAEQDVERDYDQDFDYEQDVERGYAQDVQEDFAEDFQDAEDSLNVQDAQDNFEKGQRNFLNKKRY